jgi:hypothetical protein
MRLERIQIRPARMSGESACAYLMRLAAANGYGGAAELASDLDLPWHTLAAGRGLRNLARSASCEVDALRFDSGITSPRYVRLRNEILGRRQWSLAEGRKACPLCFAEDRAATSSAARPSSAWSRTWWDIKAVTVCVRHGVALSSSCACGQGLAFEEGWVDACACGKPIPAMPSARDIDGDRYLVGRLSAGSGDEASRVRSPILDAMPLGDAIAAMSGFGRILAVSGSAPAHVRLSLGFRTFAGWPQGLHQALDEIAIMRRDEGRWGAEVAYGPIVAMARGLAQGAGSSALRQEIARHAFTSGVARAAKPVLGIFGAVKAGVTLSDAQTALGIGHARARRLLGAHSATGKGTPTLLPSQVVQRLRQRIDERSDLKDLQASLAVGKAQARSLVEAGLILRGADGKVAAGAGDVLVDALLTRCAPVRGVSLPTACRRARTGLPDACKAILSGRIDADEVIGEKGLARVAVAVAALRAVGKDARSNGMTVEEASAWLGEKWQVVRDLVASGLIARDRDGKLDPKSVEAFSRTYVPGAVLAKRFGTSPKHLPIMAASRGVRPVIAPPMARKAFYMAADAKRLG